MPRDIAEFIRDCPECQMYRLGPEAMLRTDGSLASYQIFEELAIDFIGPLPTDMVGNSYICNVICSTTLYVELFAVEAATAVIAAHCLLSVIVRYGCFRALRSDRGTHFVNGIIAEVLRLFEIQHVLTLAERPQANGMVERGGQEVMRHLRIMVAARDLRSIWSVLLPLVQRIINKTSRRQPGQFLITSSSFIRQIWIEACLLLWSKKRYCPHLQRVMSKPCEEVTRDFWTKLPCFWLEKRVLAREVPNQRCKSETWCWFPM